MDTKAAFEKWCTNQCNYTLSKTAGGTYRSMRTNLAFKVWNASRAAIEIEFPNLSEDKFCWSDGVFNLKEDISDKLTSHGIRIKGKTE